MIKNALVSLTIVATLIWLMVDREMPKPMRFFLLTNIAGLAYITLKELEADQTKEFELLIDKSAEQLVKQGTIQVPNKEEEILYPTVFATEHQDPNGVARAIQTILDSLNFRTTYRGFVDAPRFQRYLLATNLNSTVPSSNDKITKNLHLNLPQFGLQLENPPLVGVHNGLLAIDLPKKEFIPITYKKSSDLIIQARNNNERIIGVNFSGELTTQPIDEFTAFTTIGGRTRSGKSAWMRQDCLEMMLRNSNDRFYLIERKEGTFGIFEGSNQIIDTVAYDVDAASELIIKLYEVLEERINNSRLLNGAEKQAYRKWCFDNMHHLYFDEYADDEKYTPILANEIFKKGAAYGIRATLGTQMHNKTSRQGSTTMSAVLLEQSATKICFKVEFPIGSIQIIGTSDGKNLLGMGDCLYRSAQTFAIERLQTVFYTDEELQELCGKLKYSNSSVNSPQSVKEELPKYLDLTKKYIKPETTEWKILSLVRDGGKKLSCTDIARDLGLTKNLEYVNSTLELFHTNGLIHREKSRNGKSWVYFR